MHTSRSLRSSRIYCCGPTPQNMDMAVGISLLSRISRDIRYVISSSGWGPPSLISDISSRRKCFRLASSCCPCSKTREAIVVISLLGHIPAAYEIPINGSHVWFTFYADVREFSHDIPTVLHYSDNVRVAVVIFLLSFVQLRYTTFLMYSPLMAAIFDLAVVTTAENIHTSPTVLQDPGNGRVAVEIPFSATIQDQ